MSRNVQEWVYSVQYWQSGWLKGSLEEMLDEWGREGWELITVHWWGEYGDKNEGSATAIFKRPKA